MADGKLFGWEITRLRKDFCQEHGWLGIVGVLLGVVASVLGLLTFREWANAAAGACAFLVIVVGFCDYFLVPAPGTQIRAPNPWLRWSAGLLALMSAVLWIVGSIPSS